MMGVGKGRGLWAEALSDAMKYSAQVFAIK